METGPLVYNLLHRFVFIIYPRRFSFFLLLLLFILFLFLFVFGYFTLFAILFLWLFILTVILIEAKKKLLQLSETGIQMSQ